MNEAIIKQNQMEFIKREGFALQKIAQDNKEQRGAIVILIDDASKKIGICPADYYEIERAEKCFEPYVLKMIKEYNPEEEFIVVFLESKNQRVDGYRIKQKKK